MLAAGLAVACRDDAGAQEAYPTRLVRIVVPFPAGGTADILPRILADRLSEQWRQPVIVENRAGAGGNIGAEAVAGAAPDGYVLLASPPGPIAINDNLYKKLAFQPSKFEPIVVLGTVPNVLVVKPAFPAKTAQELIAHVRANPGAVNFASQGNGSTSHLSAMLFQKLTGTEMRHVPYRGTTPALQDLMGNHVDLFFDNLGSSLPLHSAGNVRILALGSPSRVPSLPDMPRSPARSDRRRTPAEYRPPSIAPRSCRHDVDRAAALDAGRLIGVDHVDRHAHAHLRAFAEAQEIHMDRIVHHGVELEVARDHAMFRAVHVEIANGGEEVARIDPLLQLLEVERDADRLLAVAVDHAGHAALATHCPGGPLAGLRTRRRAQFIDGRHGLKSLIV